MGKETLLSKINFEVVWRWKRKLASELVQKQWGGTTVFWNMLQRSLLEFKRAVQTGLLCLCPTESMWQGFKSITEAEVDADYYQSLLIWLYKMISHSTEKMKSNYFGNLPVNSLNSSLQSDLILEKKRREWTNESCRQKVKTCVDWITEVIQFRSTRYLGYC